MEQNQGGIELNYKSIKIRVQQHQVQGQTLYRIVFSDKRPPLVLTRATGTEIGRHWTSIPEGRFNEAQEIGPLIQAYFN